MAQLRHGGLTALAAPRFAAIAFVAAVAAIAVAQIVAMVAFAPAATAAVSDFVFDEPVTAVLHDEFYDSTYVAGHFTEELPRTGGGVPVVAAGDGAVATDSARLAGSVRSAVSDGVSGWYVGGNFRVAGSSSARNLVHIEGDGSLDASWRPDPNGPVNALAVAGSTLYVGGEFTSLGGATRTALGAVDLDSGAATTWDPKLSGGGVDALVASGSTLYAGGQFSSVGGLTRHHLAAISRSSGEGTAWAPEPDRRVRALALRGSTTLFVGGEFSSIGGAKRELLAALDTVSGEATAWDAQVANVDSHSVGMVRALALAGSTLYVGGRFTEVGGQARTSLAALDASSAAVASWSPTLEAAEGTPGGSVYTIETLGSRVYVGGSFGFVAGERRRAVAAFDPAGGLTPWEPHPNSGAEILSLSASDLFVYVGGTFSGAGPPRARIPHLVKLDANGAIDTGWRPDPTGAPAALALSGESLYVGGGFSEIDGETRWGLAALDRLTGEVSDWNPDASSSDGWWDPAEPAAVTSLATQGSTVYASGQFDELGGASRHFLGAVDADSGDATAWDPSPNDLVYALVAHGASVYVGGPFTSVGGAPRRHLAALDATTGIASGWNPDPDNQVTALAVSGFDVYAGGYFSAIGGKPRRSLAAVDALSGAATAWDPSPAGGTPYPTVTSLKAVGPRVYAAGDFDEVGGKPRRGLAALDAASGLASGWDPRPPASQTIGDLDATRTTAYLGGEFAYLEGRATGPYAQLSTGIAPVGGGGEPADPGCPAVFAYGVRGSRGGGEPDPPPFTDDTVGGVLDRLDGRLTATGISHERRWVHYPAAQADSIASYTSGAMQSSLELGATDLTRRLLEDAGDCPSAHFVLVGYSQGALVIRDVLPALADRAARIDSVILVADPALHGGDGHVDFHGGDISSGKGIALATRGVASALAPAVPVEFDGKVDSYCREGDVICRGVGPNDLDRHSLYRTDVPSYLSWAASRAAALVRAAEAAGAAAAGEGTAGTSAIPAPTTSAAPTPAAGAVALAASPSPPVARSSALDDAPAPPAAQGEGPIADLATPGEVRPGRALELSATGSENPDGGELRYQWDLDDDGEYETSTERPFLLHTFSPGEGGPVGLRVVDEAGRTGEASTEVEVSEAAPDVPGAPTGASAAPHPGGIDLSWQPPQETGGVPLAGYVVRDGEGAVVAVTEGAPATSLDDLEQGRSYSFSVSAFNALYEGPPSQPSAAVAPGPPAPDEPGDTPEPPVDTPEPGGGEGSAPSPGAPTAPTAATVAPLAPAPSPGRKARAPARLVATLRRHTLSSSGRRVTLVLRVRNTGGSRARAVRIVARLPKRLRDPRRPPRPISLGSLPAGHAATGRIRIAIRPGGSKTLALVVRAANAHPVIVHVTLGPRGRPGGA